MIKNEQPIYFYSLSKLGHKIGLHYNELFFDENNLNPSETIMKEIDILEHHFKTKIKAILIYFCSIFITYKCVNFLFNCIKVIIYSFY